MMVGGLMKKLKFPYSNTKIVSKTVTKLKPWNLMKRFYFTLNLQGSIFLTYIYHPIIAAILCFILNLGANGKLISCKFLHLTALLSPAG